MDFKKFKNSSSGRLLKTDRNYYAFIPNPLPPKIEYSKELVNLLSDATLQIGNLNGIGTTLPNPSLLIVPYIRREAVLSSKIEGTETSLSELFYFEAQRYEEREKEAKKTDRLEVLNYVKAMDYGIKRFKELPLCLRLIRELHGILMKDVRGKNLTPGEFRKSQNWIGKAGCALNEATFVPPPAHEMKEALSNLEKFFHSKSKLPGLIECAFVHYQFETIHPFLDGNGRIGRLLITLLLYQKEYLVYPMLYLSAFFEKHRDEYYAKLLSVSQKGCWEEWLKFFLLAVIVQSKNAINNSKSIVRLLEAYKDKIHKKKSSIYTLKLLDQVFKNPYITIPDAAIKLGTSYHTAKAAVKVLVELKILSEITDKLRGKIYCAKELLKVMEKE